MQCINVLHEVRAGEEAGEGWGAEFGRLVEFGLIKSHPTSAKNTLYIQKYII